MEIWKVIEGYENYEVSSEGRLRKSNTYKLLNPHINSVGYKMCMLTNRNQLSIHRLVAKAFIDNPLNKLYVNHINGIKHDNRVENLEWVTGRENALHSINVLGNNVSGENNGFSKLLDADVINICNMLLTDTQVNIAKKYNVSTGTIGLIAKGKIWAHVTKNIDFIPLKDDFYELNLGGAILTEEKVREICSLLLEHTYLEISKTYGVCKTAIGDIARGKTWTHVTKDFDYIPIKKNSSTSFNVLSDEDVRNICPLLMTNTYIDVANKFNVTKGTIGAIARGKTWTHVTKDFDYIPIKKNKSNK